MPGMTLRLRQSFIFNKRKNTFVQPQSVIDWTAPSGLFSSEDFLFLSAVLSSAEPNPAPAKPTDYVAAFQRWAQRLAGRHANDFLERVSAQTRDLWADTCEITWERQGQLSQPLGQHYGFENG